MLKIKDFNLVRIRYINRNLTFDKRYQYTEVTSNLGGCNLAKLKTRWSRFWANLDCDIDLGILTNKQYKNKVITLTCSKEKLFGYSNEELEDVKLELLNLITICWGIYISDIIICAI